MEGEQEQVALLYRSGMGKWVWEPDLFFYNTPTITFLNAHHNRLRSRIASGSTRLPAAADMRQLQWDPELAKVAQRFRDLYF